MPIPTTAELDENDRRISARVAAMKAENLEREKVDAKRRAAETERAAKLQALETERTAKETSARRAVSEAETLFKAAEINARNLNRQAQDARYALRDARLALVAARRAFRQID
jgi:hypothetical protein